VIVAAVMIVPVIVVMAVIMVMAVVMIVAMVTVRISRLIFLGSHEIHGPIAGIIFPAVLAPISCVPWRYM
jgi:hypothetical protein